MATDAMIRGWLELGDVEKDKLRQLIETERRQVTASPDILAVLDGWVFPNVPEPQDFFVFFGAVVRKARLDYFRDLLARIAREVWETDFDVSERYYVFGIFHINTDDGEAFRWRLRHGQFEELPGSDIACGMG